jgi:spore germination protein
MRWNRLLVVLACLFALATPVAAEPPFPNDPIMERDPSNRPPVVAAWLRNGRTTGPLAVIVAPRINSYSDLSAFSYTVERDGSLTANNPVTDAVLVDFARSNGIRVVPTVSSTWDSRNILAMLSSPTIRAKHIDAIVQIARSPLIDGVDIDYENLPPESRQPFTDFISALATRLHSMNKVLSVTVPPKIRNDDPCVVCRFADYAVLGHVADQIRIMAYEFHGRTGAPAPNAPVWWIRQVAEYSVSQIPREKIVMGIHLYAYDWGGKETNAMWWSDVMSLKDRYNGQVRYVATDDRGIVGESEMTYGIRLDPTCARSKPECAAPRYEKHSVWFVDSQYVAVAWKVIQEYKLGGIVLWRPGGEDPAIWDVMTPTTN